MTTNKLDTILISVLAIVMLNAACGSATQEPIQESDPVEENPQEAEDEVNAEGTQSIDAETFAPALVGTTW